MSLLRAMGSGLVGACALTVIHESARRVIPEAPRMDVLGKSVAARVFRALDVEVPPSEQLHDITLAGDVISNSLYYSLVGLGGPETATLRGALLGLGAGVGAVLLPEPLGLGSAPSARTNATKAMTVGWYLAGGLAAGLAYSLLAGPRRRARSGRRLS